MKKKAQSNPIMLIFGAIILVLIALAFITSVANTKSTQTDLLSVSDEQFNLQTLDCYTDDGEVNESNSACNLTVSNWYSAGDWRLSESPCYLSSVAVTNDTGTALIKDVDYVLYSSIGTIQLLNTTDTSNSSDTLSDNVVESDYSYCDSGYLTSSGDRGLANLWTTMMILVLIGGLVAIVLRIWKG